MLGYRAVLVSVVATTVVATVAKLGTLTAKDNLIYLAYVAAVAAVADFTYHG
jgi:hypothetical protein